MRVCDITKETMTEGFCIRDGEMYIKYEKDLINYIRKIEKKGNPQYDKDVAEGRLTDNYLLQDYYQCDFYYYTEWED
jgi:hypothetical protein